MYDKEMEKLLFGVIESSSDGVIALREGVVVYANATANRLAQRDLAGCRASELFGPAALPVLHQVNGENQLECFFFDRPVRMEVQKKADLLVFVIRQDEYQEQEPSGSELVADIGNDIRSALSILMSVMETTLKDGPYWGVAYKNVCRILRCVFSANLLFTNQNTFELEMETNELVERLSRNRDELAELLKPLGITVVFETRLKRLDVVLNRQAIRRTFLTLIGEAISRVGPNGHIGFGLDVTESGHEAIITIWDERAEGTEAPPEPPEMPVNKAVTNWLMRQSRGVILRERRGEYGHAATMFIPIQGTEIDYMNISGLETEGISQMLVELSGVLPGICFQAMEGQT